MYKVMRLVPDPTIGKKRAEQVGQELPNLVLACKRARRVNGYIIGPGKKFVAQAFNSELPKFIPGDISSGEDVPC